MVEYALSLDQVFGCLSNPTRRDMLRRLASDEMTITDLATPYKLTFAAVSKHLKVLEKARLIIKSRKGREQFVKLAPTSLREANEYLQFYQKLMSEQITSLDNYSNKEKKDVRDNVRSR